MATYSELSATLKFEDGQTKTVTFSPYYPTDSAVSGFKTRAMAVNNASASVFPAIHLEDEDGQDTTEFSKISAATITTTEKSVIFAKTESARIAALEMAGDE